MPWYQPIEHLFSWLKGKLSDGFIKKVVSKGMGIVEAAMRFSDFRSQSVGKKATKVKKVRGIAKLDDAWVAGDVDALGHAWRHLRSKGFARLLLLVHRLQLAFLL